MPACFPACEDGVAGGLVEVRMAMKQALVGPALAFLLVGCVGDLQSNSHEYSLVRGSVRMVNTNETLLTFCQGGFVADRSGLVQFSAPAGSVVQEEVLFEGRTEKYHGGVPPVRDDAFWCGPTPNVYLRPVEYWTCLRNADADPPATILNVEQRGELGLKESSSGYALTLEVRHPGILRVVFDVPCLLKHTDVFSDAVAPRALGELTIL
jgi:hypothetical protein